MRLKWTVCVRLVEWWQSFQYKHIVVIFPSTFQRIESIWRNYICPLAVPTAAASPLPPSFFYLDIFKVNKMNKNAHTTHINAKRHVHILLLVWDSINSITFRVLFVCFFFFFLLRLLLLSFKEKLQTWHHFVHHFGRVFFFVIRFHVCLRAVPCPKWISLLKEKLNMKSRSLCWCVALKFWGADQTIS